MEIEGILIVNKPHGITSHDVVKEIRKIFHTKKVGHTGTLDPEATGVLPICIGKATKFAQFLLASDKEYKATMTLGIETDTQDLTGKVISRKKVTDMDTERIKKTFSTFRGEIEQIPPMVSAVRHKGKKLYELARQGKQVERTPRKVRILDIEILDFKLPRITFRIVCSKGTYVRTLTSDIGEKLGCGAHQAQLTRLRSGPFKLSDAVTIDELKKTPNPQASIIPIEKALSYLPPVEVKDWFKKFVKKNALIPKTDIVRTVKATKSDLVRITNSRRGLLGIGEVQTTADGEAAVVKVLRSC